MNTSRRKFIRNTTSAAAGIGLLGSYPFRASGNVAPSDMVKVALVGCRSMGFNILKLHLQQPGVECVALCDVDANVLENRANDVLELQGKKPKIYKDYRKLLENKDIDAVIIGTPDHWHCLIMVDACAAGKDVYVEKPMANSIGECDIMVAAARRYNRVVQVGMQQRSAKHWHEAINIIRNGRLGKVRKVSIWANFLYGNGPDKLPDQPVPGGVNYDMWLGPAPYRPFNPNHFHGSWRMFWDFGGGLMTDWGVHLIDMGIWAMDLQKAPDSVLSMGGIFDPGDNAIEVADTQTAVYADGDFNLVWDHNGGIQSGPWNRNYGVAFIGQNGTIVADRDNWEHYPEWENGDFKMEKLPKMEKAGNSHEEHVKNFLQCIKTRETPNCDVEKGRLAAIYAHLGNLSYRLGRKLNYDMEKHEFMNDSEANKYLLPEYRAPWSLPKV